MPEFRRRLGLTIVTLHFGAYAAVNAFAFGQLNDPLLELVCSSVFPAQLVLLCLWAGLGTGRWAPRLIAAYVGLVLLTSLPEIVRGQFLATNAMSSAIVMAVFLTPLAIVRKRGFTLRRFDPHEVPKRGGLQTTIRGMLIVTVVVACLLGLGAIVGDGVTMHLNGVSYGVSGPRSGVKIVMLASLTTLFVGTGMLSIWSTLSAGTVCSRMVVSAAALAAGAAFMPYAFNGDAASYAYWSGLVLLMFLITAFTLLPFRWVGYRFVRETPPEASVTSRDPLENSDP